jgi:thiol:disulfide interchange protein
MSDNHHPFFDADRDPYLDLQTARARALRERKNILIELGADWCVWCERLETFIQSHPELHLLRSHLYVHVRIHAGDGETFSEVCKLLPAFESVPHYFVFRAQGQFLHSQETSSLEDGDSYDYEKVWEFLSMWADKNSKIIIQ